MSDHIADAGKMVPDTIEQAARVICRSFREAAGFMESDDYTLDDEVENSWEHFIREAQALHEAGMLVSGERRGDVSMLLIEFANAIADANMERRIECLKVFSERIKRENEMKDLAHSGFASIPTEPVFVFGSNLAGRHGKGAALWARQHRGAIYGVGKGPQGNSYAIPTKDERLRTLPLAEIEMHVVAFLIFAEAARGLLRFQVTPIGCGLAGYSPEQIAPFFRLATDNVILPPEFTAVLNSGADATSRSMGMSEANEQKPPATPEGKQP